MKETDKIIHQHDGYREVSAVAKNGKATFVQYDNVDTLLKNMVKDRIITMINRMIRVDAINEVNRPEATPSAVRQLGKLAKGADEETKALIEKATLKIIADAEARKAAATK